MRSITKMLLWFVFLLLPLLVGIILHFVSGEPMFDYLGNVHTNVIYWSQSSIDERGVAKWMGYGIVVEMVWIVVSGLVLSLTMKPEQQDEGQID